MKKARYKGELMRYTGAGLNDIWLVNGYTVRDSRYGRSVSVEDAEGLHKAIGLCLVDNRAKLSGAEFRFLRKELDMSQKRLGRFIGVSEQSIASWEKNSNVQPYGDRLIRVLYKEVIEGNVEVLKLIKLLNDIDRQKSRKIVFKETEEGWIPNAA